MGRGRDRSHSNDGKGGKMTWSTGGKSQHYGSYEKPPTPPPSPMQRSTTDNQHGIVQKRQPTKVDTVQPVMQETTQHDDDKKRKQKIKELQLEKTCSANNYPPLLTTLVTVQRDNKSVCVVNPTYFPCNYGSEMS